MIETRPMTPAETAARVTSTKPGQPVAKTMAADMIDIAAAKGCCEEGDLVHRGWGRDDLAKYGEEANRLALAASVRAVS